MRQDLTDITLVVDRSGSMQTCMMEAQSGINAFIEDQKKKQGEAIFSLLQFDTEHEYVFKAAPIASVSEYKLIPRGMTALLDAVGRVINETGERLASMPEEQRPGLVIVAIITDGEENSSHEFSKAQIRDMIKRQEGDYKWQFTFLGANQDAFAEAHSIGIGAAATVQYSTAKSANTYQALSASVGRMRGQSYAGNTVSCSYTNDERNAVK